MAFSYLTPDNLYEAFKDSEKSMLQLFTPLKDHERLARNRPHPGIDKAYPKTTDGTLAAIIQETPKRYIQQVPTGVVETNIGEWFDVFATWKLTEDIIPHANCQADVLQKSWQAGSKSMTYGCQPAFVYMDSYGDYMGANFKLPYITHVYLERGKISDRESKKIFLESWYEESDIDYIIDREKKLKKEDPSYEGEWDIKELEAIKKKRTSKPEDQKTPKERDSKDNADSSADGIRIIHAFQVGVGAKFYSFIPDESQGGKAKLVRTKVNKDPRGVIPIHYLYYNIDLSSPLGRGICEMSGGMQNLIDSHVQAFQYMQALMMNPPMLKRGNVARGSIKFVPNAVIDLGTDTNASVEPLQINTQAISNFPQTYGLMKSQILALNSTNDTTVSSSAGDPASSKTQAGVKATMEKMGVSDNYARKQYEAWYGDICETMLNITFAETSGVREENLTKKTADKLRQIIPEGNEVIIWDEEKESTIYVDYDKLGEEPVYFRVDASTSQLKEDSQQVENLATAKELVIDILPPSKRMQLANKFINKLGVDDPEDITFSEEEIAMALEAEQNPPMPEQAMQAEDPMVADQLAQDPQTMLMQLMDQYQIPEQYDQSAVALLQEGLQPEEIVQVIMQSLQKGAMNV